MYGPSSRGFGALRKAAWNQSSWSVPSWWPHSTYFKGLFCFFCSMAYRSCKDGGVPPSHPHAVLSAESLSSESCSTCRMHLSLSLDWRTPCTADRDADSGIKIPYYVSQQVQNLKIIYLAFVKFFFWENKAEICMYC